MTDNEKLRISINNKTLQFEVNGKRIWMNGANTPWNRWNDFGADFFNENWWDNEFSALHQAGINCTRVWINCNNTQGAVLIGDDGMISGVSEKHWEDLAVLFKLAEKHKIYIMATLISFDHFKHVPSAINRETEANKWRSMLYSEKASISFAENYTTPLIKRFGNNPWFWCVDLCNEPDWVYENSECGKIPWDNISRFFAHNACAVHKNCAGQGSVLVTTGICMVKYTSDFYEGNKISDSCLQKFCPDKDACMDFWSPHYYDWEGLVWGPAFYMNPYEAADAYKLEASKPAVIAECTAKGSKGKTKGTENNTIVSDYEAAFKNGWQGVMPWTSNGVDSNGNLDDLKPGTLNMLEKHRELIFPWGE